MFEVKRKTAGGFYWQMLEMRFIVPPGFSPGEAQFKNSLQRNPGVQGTWSILLWDSFFSAPGSQAATHAYVMKTPVQQQKIWPVSFNTKLHCWRCAPNEALDVVRIPYLLGHL
jgi:hypothetical protein